MVEACVAHHPSTKQFSHETDYLKKNVSQMLDFVVPLTAHCEYRQRSQRRMTHRGEVVARTITSCYRRLYAIRTERK